MTQEAPLKLCIINPNSTVRMTETIVKAARSVAGPGVEIIGRTAHGAPASIEGHRDEVMCAPYLLAEVQKAEAEGADAIVVACFDDPAIGEHMDAVWHDVVEQPLVVGDDQHCPVRFA